LRLLRGAARNPFPARRRGAACDKPVRRRYDRAAARDSAARNHPNERQAMRIMVKFAFPVATGNVAIRDGKVAKVFHQIMDELKPEAAYFYPDGERGGFIVVNMDDSSQIVQIAERFFFGLNASIEMVPVMAAEDLEKGLAAVPDIIQRYS
jgi:hypothetical protein